MSLRPSHGTCQHQVKAWDLFSARTLLKLMLPYHQADV